MIISFLQQAKPIVGILGTHDNKAPARSPSMEGSHLDDVSTAFHQLHPDLFTFMVVPESAPMPVNEPYVWVNEVYLAAWRNRIERAKEFYATVFDDVPDQARKQQIASALEANFRQWLDKSGKSRHLQDLERAVAEGKGGPQNAKA